MIAWEKVKHFSPEEFEPDPSKVHPDVVYVMDAIRDQANCPVIIHCTWADKVGHSSKSKHYLIPALACDFHFKPGKLSNLEQFGIISGQSLVGAIGFYPEWLPCPGWHMDIRKDRPRVYWVSNGRGGYFYGIDVLEQAIKGK
jgi:hypothetical protein